MLSKGLCDQCQDCVLTTDNTSGYFCKDNPNICENCMRCVRTTGLCSPLRCGTCAACDLSVDRCIITPNSTCGTNPDCQMCDLNGLCLATVNKSCPMQDDDACRNPYCNAAGECVMSTDFSAVGTPCKPATDCMAYVCTADGRCVEQPMPRNTSCSLPNVDPDCQIAVCSGSGECVVQDVTAGTPCSVPVAHIGDRNLTLCHQYTCAAGLCVAHPLLDGTNCTHRRNESDLEVPRSPSYSYMTHY